MAGVTVGLICTFSVIVIDIALAMISLSLRLFGLEVDFKEFRMLNAETLEEVTHVTTRMVSFGVSSRKPGVGSPQQHAHSGVGEECESIYFVLKGTGILYAGKDKKEIRMKPGMWIYIPADCPHGLVTDGSEDFVMTELMTPPPVRILVRAGIIKLEHP